MSELDTLTQLSNFPALVAAERNELIAFWNNGAIPPANLKPGTPMWDLVATYSGEAQALNRARIDVLRRTSSLYELVHAPELADEEAVDRILSNYWTRSRNEGKYSKGYVAIFRNSPTIFTIPRNTVFIAGELRYQTSSVYVATPAALNNPSDRKLVQLADGTWRVVIPVTAEEPGEKYDIAAGTAMTWSWVSNTEINIIRAEADSDFTGGMDPETNEELLERQDSMIAAPGMAGRMNIEALLRKQFPEIIDISLIGAGDIEMQRDGRNVLGLKVGGKTDAYVRTSYSVVTRDFELEAEVVDAAAGLLRIKVDRDVFPGFYMMSGVYRTDAATDYERLTVTSVMYGKNTAGLSYDVPTMDRLVDYRFTRFQTLEFEFTDPGFDPENLVYRVDLTGIPSIGEIQDYVAQRQVRSPNNDMLIKAAVPMFVAVNMTIKYQRADAAIDEEAVHSAIRTAVNRTKFKQGVLTTSSIICGVQGVLPSLAQVSVPVDLLGQLVLPVRGPTAYYSTTELEPSTIAEESTSSRNVAFYCTSIQVATEPINPKQV